MAVSLCLEAEVEDHTGREYRVDVDLHIDKEVLEPSLLFDVVSYVSLRKSSNESHRRRSVDNDACNGETWYK